VRRPFIFVAAATVFVITPGRAGYPQATAGTVDTLSAVAGARDGRLAADRPSVAGRFATGFAGGIPAGFFGLPALGEHDALFVIGAGTGFAIIGGAVAGGSTDPPPAVADSAAARGPAYEQAFRKEYGARLHGRRASAALLGGVTGVVSGIALLVWLLSTVNFD
jgi:hypothetical protein